MDTIDDTLTAVDIIQHTTHTISYSTPHITQHTTYHTAHTIAHAWRKYPCNNKDTPASTRYPCNSEISLQH